MATSSGGQAPRRVLRGQGAGRGPVPHLPGGGKGQLQPLDGGYGQGSPPTHARPPTLPSQTRCPPV